MPTPSKPEKQNGWTEEKLTAYVDEAEERAAKRILPEKKRVAKIQNAKSYNPMRW